MTEQPGDALDEAAKLFGSLWRRIGGTGGGNPGQRGAMGEPDDVWSRATADDVWSRAAAGDPHIATGAPECRNCPICRAIALARETGPDVTTHVRQAGQSLMAAAFDVLAAFERTRAPGRPNDHRAPSEPGGSRPPGEGGGGPSAGNDPIDIG
ncbi:hypothetical protein [Spirillospora sp. NPDC047279]|uniref:hypothetical protein n=1 Tax=Spirillospora sp. NPDC047279 TaxID=3155478 RepID=UPI0033DA1748